MAACGHIASRPHGAPAGVARVNRSKLSGEAPSLANRAVPGGRSIHAGRVRGVAATEQECLRASSACEGEMW